MSDERTIESLTEELNSRRRWQRRFSRTVKRRLLLPEARTALGLLKGIASGVSTEEPNHG